MHFLEFSVLKREHCTVEWEDAAIALNSSYAENYKNLHKTIIRLSYVLIPFNLINLEKVYNNYLLKIDETQFCKFSGACVPGAAVGFEQKKYIDGCFGDFIFVIILFVFILECFILMCLNLSLNNHISYAILIFVINKSQEKKKNGRSDTFRTLET